jgi:hypothetical protein
MARRKKENEHVFARNVEGGYEIWCGHCGASDRLILRGTEGIPVTGKGSFVEWLETFGTEHERCRIRDFRFRLPVPIFQDGGGI